MPTCPPVVAQNTHHLRELVQEEMRMAGPRCDLNHLDVSHITDMARLFKDSTFDGNIAHWDVTNVRVFDEMFRGCPFQGDLSQWNTASAVSMRRMFQGSPFNGDISRWSVAKLVHAAFMFEHGRFNGDISAWRPVALENANEMFHCSRFDGDVSQWQLPNLRNATAMFDKTSFNGDLSSWHLPKLRGNCAARMVSGTYTGVLPHIGGDFKERRDFYRNIFKTRRGATGLAGYLEDHAFNTTHLDLAFHSPARTPGVSPDNMAWIHHVKAVGQALGLDDDALWAYALASFKERGREMVVSDVDFGMVGGD